MTPYKIRLWYAKVALQLAATLPLNCNKVIGVTSADRPRRMWCKTGMYQQMLQLGSMASVEKSASGCYALKLIRVSV